MLIEPGKCPSESGAIPHTCIRSKGMGFITLHPLRLSGIVPRVSATEVAPALTDSISCTNGSSFDPVSFWHT